MLITFIEVPILFNEVPVIFIEVPIIFIEVPIIFNVKKLFSVANIQEIPNEKRFMIFVNSLR